MDVDLDRVISKAISFGASYVDVRYQEYMYETILVENKFLKEYSKRSLRGIGIRVIVNGGVGFASTNNITYTNIEKAIKRAIEIAKVMSFQHKIKLAETKVIKDSVKSHYVILPEDIDHERKVNVVLEANKASFINPDIKSATTRLGIQMDKRVFKSSEGTEIEVSVILTGISHISVAKYGAILERVPHQNSYVAGWEFIEKNDWVAFTQDLSNLALKAVKAKTPPPGTYTAVVDSEIIGLLLHEAFGHATEGDLVSSGESILKGKIGKKVASEVVTIVDEGVVEGGYFVPYDDEGVPKRRTVIVDKGVLKSYLTSRKDAIELNMELTGNGRAQDYENIPIVRQTNYFMVAGDYKFDELIEGIKFGIYIKGKGATGGQVNPGMGTFTFSVGPSYLIRNGEIKEMVRGVVVSGYILETLKEVEAVGKDLVIRTSVFGGCGKENQMVRVGDGGPHVRIRKIIVGGR